MFFGAINYRPTSTASCSSRARSGRSWPAPPRARVKIRGAIPHARDPRPAGSANRKSPEWSTICGRTGAAAVTIVPLRVGGGTRFKILEAMAMAKAVVSTAIGRGIDVLRGGTSSSPTRRGFRSCDRARARRCRAGREDGREGARWSKDATPGTRRAAARGLVRDICTPLGCAAELRKPALLGMIEEIGACCLIPGRSPIDRAPPLRQP